MENKCCGKRFCSHKMFYGALFVAVVSIVMLAWSSWAHAGTANFEPTYKTVTTYKTITECRTVEGDAVGGAILGGLLGSAVGNGLTSADGAGGIGAALGAIIGANEAQPRQKCNQRQVPNGSYQELTGYNVWIQGSQYWVPAK